MDPIWLLSAMNDAQWGGKGWRRVVAGESRRDMVPFLRDCASGRHMAGKSGGVRIANRISSPLGLYARKRETCFVGRGDWTVYGKCVPKERAGYCILFVQWSCRGIKESVDDE
ncbi:hypothetical protein V565_018310 [Rhizoctonia solani 123E]|uniref:Uncharacterized protein n=1 Tax=Rhizoctonia solani 123E TaxID=1423351 RepID=A0A074S4P9_9AGAM|nr:hypothetical protein V565_018310 [Rhizoctonia solani 123E]